MFSRTACLLSIAVLMLVCPCSWGEEEAQTLLERQAEDGTLPGWKLFSAQPETSWRDTWQLKEGVLICRGVPKGYIYTKKNYGDFVLRLQWRWPKGQEPGNGGVLIRMTGPHKVWPKSLEAQLNANQAGDFWGLDGFELDGPAERRKVVDHADFGKLTNLAKMSDLEKPAGQWNQYEIIAQGDTVTLKVNGQVINRATRCELQPGPICLTAEGNEIHFRKIELIEKP